MSEHINLAFAGLGVLKLAPNPSQSPTETEDLDELERLTITELLKPLHINRDLLMKEGAIGELSYNFFDSTGNSTPNWDIFSDRPDESSFRARFLPKPHKQGMPRRRHGWSAKRLCPSQSTHYRG
jgi:hypothetical protein